jgi:predicted ATPase/DNA-binding SARP family transcriptional activator
MRVPNQSGDETLTIRTLGEVTIALQSSPVTGEAVSSLGARRVQFATRTVDALLIYLACQGRPLGRDALAELFWPERTHKQARSNLRVALHRLRHQLAPYLLVTHHSVALNLDRMIDLDAAHFETHLAAGQVAAAVALYTNDFLDGFYLDGSPAFEQWALLERERLRTLALAAYQQLIDQSAAAGQGSTAITTAQRLLQLDPLHEPTHRQLMRLLAQMGQRSAALVQYETCRHLLAVELDAPPDEATTALYEQIRANDLGLAILDFGLSTQQADASNPKSQITNLKSHNLPPQPTPLIGRSAELAQLEQLLANPDCQLLTLLGVGGIGKTRLAIEAAWRQTSHFADGVYFVALAPISSGEFVLTTLAQSLGIHATSGGLQAEIAAYLHPRAVLLVLDNFEHLVATPDSDPGTATDLLVYLLQHAPRLKLLVTSRTRLALREEWLLPIAGLSLAEDLAGEAGQLFLRSAQRVQPGFTGEGQEAAIATICQQVEGMPLALELAASWVRVMSCAEIARQIGANFDFLTSPLRNLPVRHRSLRALFDQSWRLLSPLEQGVLMRLSVFRGGWLVDEAAPVTGATLALLLGLVDKSLVRASDQERFDLHELVRQYAAEQLVASVEADLIRHRHYAAYLHLFRIGDSHLRGPAAVPWFARLALEQDNLRTALQWSLDEKRYEDTAWLVLAANWFWDHHGQSYEAARWLAQLLPHRQLLDADLHLALLIVFHAFALAVEEFQPVDRYREEMIELLETSPHQLLQVAAWSWVAAYSADFSQACIAWERSIALARTASDAPSLGIEFGLLADRDFMLGATLSVYATRLCEHGKLMRAASVATESFQFFQAHGNRYERAGGLGTLGHVALLRGDLAQARTFLQEAVQIATEVHSDDMLSLFQPLLALVILYSGNVTEARRLLTESLHLCLELKYKTWLAHSCTYLAETALWEGTVDEAAQWLAQSLGYHTKPRWITIYEVERLWVAARLATAQQQYQRAATLFGLAEQISSRLDYVVTGPRRLAVDTALATVQAALDPAAFAEAFAVGQQMSLEEAFATLLAPAYGVDLRYRSAKKPRIVQG